jgi:hypothetical protein
MRSSSKPSVQNFPTLAANELGGIARGILSVVVTGFFQKHS